jgi:hypothetical protein
MTKKRDPHDPTSKFDSIEIDLGLNAFKNSRRFIHLYIFNNIIIVFNINIFLYYNFH